MQSVNEEKGQVTKKDKKKTKKKTGGKKHEPKEESGPLRFFK